MDKPLTSQEHEIIQQLILDRWNPHRIHRTKHLEEELHEIRETAVDDAEHMLFRKIEEGHVASIIFFLKCFGKNRGYVERPERTSTPPRGQIVIPRRELTLEEWEANNRALEREKDC